MHGQICVGGILENGQYVRLLDAHGYNQPEDTLFNVRQIWDIDFIVRPDCVPPHVEDVLLHQMNRVGELPVGVALSKHLINNLHVPIWEGAPEELFDGALLWTNSGSGYINDQNICANSVGFWVSDRDLTQNDYKGVRYKYPSRNGWRTIKFVGFQEPVEVIPVGTLMRVSLARWWQQDENTEERCYLQLSGWYL